MLRDSTSTSPDCRAVNRSFALSGVNFTFWASPKTAAATARQRSMSSPDQLFCASTVAKPGMPCVGHAALDKALLLHGVVSLPGLGIRREERDRDGTCRDAGKVAHSLSLSPAKCPCSSERQFTKCSRLKRRRKAVTSATARRLVARSPRAISAASSGMSHRHAPAHDLRRAEAQAVHVAVDGAIGRPMPQVRMLARRSRFAAAWPPPNRRPRSRTGARSCGPCRREHRKAALCQRVGQRRCSCAIAAA